MQTYNFSLSPFFGSKPKNLSLLYLLIIFLNTVLFYAVYPILQFSYSTFFFTFSCFLSLSQLINTFPYRISFLPFLIVYHSYHSLSHIIGESISLIPFLYLMSLIPFLIVLHLYLSLSHIIDTFPHHISLIPFRITKTFLCQMLLQPFLITSHLYFSISHIIVTFYYRISLSPSLI